MSKYQEWKWYDTIGVSILFCGLIFCLFLKEYILGIICLLIILMILLTFQKEIYLKLAKKELNKNNPKKAMDYCEKVLKNKPNYLYGLIIKGEIYEYQNKNEEALKIYNKSIKEYPKEYTLWQKKGKLYDKLNNNSQANESYKIANTLKTAENENKIYYKLMKRAIFKK